MARFRAGISGNPSGRPKAARGLRDLLQAKYGADGEGLVRELDGLTRSRNLRVRLEALRLLAAYLYGPPQQRVEVEVGQSTTREVTPEMLACLTTEELLFLKRLWERWEPPERAPNRLLPPDGSNGA